MKTFLLLASGFLLYAFFREFIPWAFVARVRYVTAMELAPKKAPVPKNQGLFRELGSRS